MERKALIRRAALVGLAVLVGCGLVALAAWLKINAGWREQRRQREEQRARLTQEYQAYLDQTAKKIQGLPVDPRVVGEIQTRHYQERPGRWVYVWASTNGGDFAFGVPSDAFARLNVVYEQYQSAIAQDNFYAGRDQFLRTLLHTRRPIVLAPRDDDRDPGQDWWRFHRESDSDYRMEGPNSIHLSSPIQGAGGATVGNLNLKVVDEKDAPLYWSWNEYEGRHPWFPLLPVAGALAFFSALWLWFLLPSWVYIDARERGVPRPLLWSALTLFGSAFALMVYLVTRPADIPEVRCPQCRKALNAATRAGCPYCGADLSTAFCAQCQYPVKPDWTFCPSCRTALSRPASA
jgi:hypothetical protein